LTAALTDLDVDALPRGELPALLGRLTELEARVRLRLAEPPAPKAESRALDPDAAAALAGVSRRWLLEHTRGLACRRDHSRKNVRFDEAGLRAWLTTRRGR
jgi:hypothetical protein